MMMPVRHPFSAFAPENTPKFRENQYNYIYATTDKRRQDVSAPQAGPANPVWCFLLRLNCRNVIGRATGVPDL